MERSTGTTRSTGMKLAAAVVLALVLAPASAAKGPLHARICGASGCLTTLLDARGFWPSGVQSGTMKPVGPARYLTIELTSPGSGWLDFRYRYVPAQRLLRVDLGQGNKPYWRRAPTEVVRALAPYVRRLGPMS